MEERKANITVCDQEPRKVVIIDNGEDFKSDKGSIPNHDKIEIVYSADK